MEATGEQGHNGWKNWETWNVALWIDNEEALYKLARSLRFKMEPYRTFSLLMLEAGSKGTPDGVAWDDAGLDRDELDRMIEEL